MAIAMKNKTKMNAPEEKKNTVLNQEEVAKLAYELYEKRGCEYGKELEDWLQAEKILNGCQGVKER